MSKEKVTQPSSEKWIPSFRRRNNTLTNKYDSRYQAKTLPKKDKVPQNDINNFPTLI